MDILMRIFLPSRQREFDEIQRRSLDPQSSDDLRIGRLHDGYAVQLAAIGRQNDQRKFRMGGLTQYFVVHVWYYVRDESPFVTLEYDVFFVRVANSEQMVAPRIDEIDETIHSSVVEAFGNYRLVVFLEYIHLHQLPLVRVIEKSAIPIRIRDKNIRFLLRLHVPQFSPYIQSRELFVERYLTVRRS